MKPIRCHADNLAKHGVRESEVRECLAGVHVRFRNPSGRRGTYLVVGQASSGRYLELVFEDKGNYWWVFHAMTARPSLVRLFRKWRKQHGR